MEQSLQTAILKTGAKLFLKYGLRSVSVDDICNTLRISKKTFYTYYSQKEELIEAVLTDIEGKKQRKRATCPEYTEVGVIDKIIEFAVNHVRNKNNQFINFYFDLAKYYPDIHTRQLQRSREAMKDIIAELLTEGIQEGVFRSDIQVDMMTEYLIVQIMMGMEMAHKEELLFKKQHSFDFLIDTLIRILCTPEGLASYLEKKSILSEETTEVRPPLKDEEIDQLVDQLID
jgi:AcrR family transcriptional regulator